MEGTRVPLLDDQMLREQIRSVGLRVTLSRLQVLAMLATLGSHHSVDEVVQALQVRGITLPRASVYNAMNDFVRTGLVQIADAGPGRALYEIAQSWHHHFVCRQCGVVIDVPCLVGEKPCLEAYLPGYLIAEAQIIFRGLCPECQRNIPGKKNVN